MTLIFFILMIGGLIFLHELGHMLFAKLFNVYVREFAVGFGPAIFSFVKGETKYSLRAIPLGGFTGMVEEAEEIGVEAVDEEGVLEESVDEEGNYKLRISRNRTFYGVNPFKRIMILFAGPLFNFITATLIFMMIFVSNGSVAVYPEAIIETVQPGYPAALAGIEVNDKIVGITYSNGDSVKIENTYDVSINNQMHKGSYTVHIDRNGQLLDFDVTPVYSQETETNVIGIVFGGEVTFKKLSFLQALSEGAKYTLETCELTVKSVVSLFTGQVGMESVSGTIGMYSYTQEALSYGFISYLALVGSISVSLGIMNLVPIPAFDGGRIFLTLIEIVMGRRINKKLETIILYAGILAVLALFVLVTISDVAKLIG